MSVATEGVSASNSVAQDAKEPSRSGTKKAMPPATDDEILGLSSSTLRSMLTANAQSESGASGDGDSLVASQGTAANGVESDEPPALKAAFDANPELRQAWQDAHAYREMFATPADARKATQTLADLDRMDALFFSGRPEDHAQLAQLISSLDPKDFVSLAREMGALAANLPAKGNAQDAAIPTTQESSLPEPRRSSSPSAETAAQEQFLVSANAAAVQSVIEAVEGQVARLLPEGVSKSTRGRLVGEIYREVDAALQSNRDLKDQLRAAFKSGTLDTNHQKAIVSLMTARAKQALPGVAKRVLGEWSSAVLASHNEERARQRAGERRVDIVGSSAAGNDGRRSMTPRDIDYARMSDSDILNL